MSQEAPPRPEAGRPSTSERMAAGFSSFTKSFKLGDGRGRIRVAVVLVLFVMSIYAVRLIDLQTIRADSLASEAKGLRTVKRVLPASRGTIFDVNGVPLAQSIPGKNITVDPTQVLGCYPETADCGANKLAYAEKLSALLDVPVQDLVKKLTVQFLANGNPIKYAFLKRSVPTDVWNKVLALEFVPAGKTQPSSLVGIFSEPTALRKYPSGEVGANVIGYMGVDPNTTKDVPMAGVEAQLNQRLAGVDGEKVFEQSSTGGAIPTGNDRRVDPVAGQDVRLTIDRDLQWKMQTILSKRVKELEADHGMAIAMEPDTGKIRAMVSAPTDNPNDSNRNAELLKNHAIEDAFEPGSTAKVMTIAGALNEGKITPSSPVITVPNRLERGGQTFADDEDHPVYKMTPAGILAWSSNLGTIQIAEKIGGNKLYGYHQAFGITRPSGVGLPQENPGSEFAPKNWSPTTFPTLAFGQSLSWNMVQASMVFATIANGGLQVQPSVVDAYLNADGSVEEPAAPEARRVISEEAAKATTEMMEQVSTQGTGSADPLRFPGYRIAAKTGTAQRYDEKTGGYNGYDASFYSFLPADDPKLVVLVTISNPPRGTHFGATAAGPAWKEMVNYIIQKYGIPPSSSKSPKMELFSKDSNKGLPWNYKW